MIDLLMFVKTIVCLNQINIQDINESFVIFDPFGKTH